MDSVPTQVLCPVCKGNGQPNRLHKSLSSDGMFCLDPKRGLPLHNFQNFDQVEAYDPSMAFLEPQEAVVEPEVAPTPKEVPAPPVEAPKAISAPVKGALDPLPVEVRSPEPTPVTEVIGKVLKDRRLPSTVVELAPKPEEFHAPPPRFLRGGDMILTVRIPEQHVSFLIAEAEGPKGTTVEKYFQEQTVYGLDSRWYY